MLYPILHITHLLCATLFIGVVLFETLILRGLRKPLGPALFEQVESAVMRRAVWIMPPVVAVLFITGGLLLWQNWPLMDFREFTWPPLVGFTLILTIKVALALSVLVHFVLAIRAELRGTLSERASKWVHLSVSLHVVAILILAKLIFYVNW
ncbi:hypothetical protein [Maritimibacter sp. DP1N21-5]|uniref:hypothetical protein n=1 Tax=Maritimibacter sp. DP1N21-5 TaxID=2836867 RepID=UPI001C47CB58|nr:hypothetical protein [Maritimibacter sp. DP1N21-5]MBV7408097.1 hypothetical protein [Maritimibacter sp. DP1N21-5]